MRSPLCLTGHQRGDTSHICCGRNRKHSGKGGNLLALSQHSYSARPTMATQLAPPQGLGFQVALTRPFDNTSYRVVQRRAWADTEMACQEKAKTRSRNRRSYRSIQRDVARMCTRTNRRRRCGEYCYIYSLSWSSTCSHPRIQQRSLHRFGCSSCVQH